MGLEAVFLRDVSFAKLDFRSIFLGFRTDAFLAVVFFFAEADFLGRAMANFYERELKAVLVVVAKVKRLITNFVKMTFLSGQVCLCIVVRLLPKFRCLLTRVPSANYEGSGHQVHELL